MALTYTVVEGQNWWDVKDAGVVIGHVHKKPKGIWHAEIYQTDYHGLSAEPNGWARFMTGTFEEAMAALGAQYRATRKRPAG